MRDNGYVGPVDYDFTVLKQLNAQKPAKPREECENDGKL